MPPANESSKPKKKEKRKFTGNHAVHKEKQFFFAVSVSKETIEKSGESSSGEEEPVGAV